MSVYILLGADYYSLRPKPEVASEGKKFRLMKDEPGVCNQTRHLCLVENTGEFEIVNRL